MRNDEKYTGRCSVIPCGLLQPVGEQVDFRVDYLLVVEVGALFKNVDSGISGIKSGMNGIGGEHYFRDKRPLFTLAVQVPASEYSEVTARR